MLQQAVQAVALAAGLHVGAAPAASLFAGADPGALVSDSTVWLYPTGDGATLYAWSSRDLVTWRRGRKPLLELRTIGWQGDDHAPRHYLWAPQMAECAGHFRLFFGVGPQNPTPSRLGVAECTGPGGPCRDSGKPLITGDASFEAIDPAVFIDEHGGAPLLLAGASAGPRLRAWTLTDDCRAIEAEVPIAQPPNFTEGVFLHKRGDLYYLSWSHGHWNDSSYSVHYATGSAPTGPWTYRGVILQSDRRFKGPGHHAFFMNPADGRWYIVYHRWEAKSGAGPYSGQRRVAIAPVTYTADGSIEPIAMDDDAAPAGAGSAPRR